MSRPESDGTTSQDAIDFPCVLLRVSRLWRDGMNEDELYDITHGWWRTGPRRELADYALAVAGGVVRGVFAIQGWRPRILADDLTSEGPVRWGFDGEPAPELDHLIGLDVRDLFSKGAANPVRYMNIGGAAVVPDEPEAREDVNPTQVDELAKLCQQLNDNPVLHLSLGSKELFHSNLLGWLLERDAAVAEYALEPWLEAEPAQSRFHVCRECNNLDLIVRVPGFRPVVIENKVFSLPDEQQLDRYAAVNMMAAEVPNATRILLSLSDPDWANDTYNGWRWASYSELMPRVLSATTRHLAHNDFVSTLVKNWVAMMDDFDQIAELTQPRNEQPFLLDGDSVALLQAIRLHDAFQKFRNGAVARELRRRMMASNITFSGVRAEFTKGTPLLSAWLDLKDGSSIGWQLQSNQWRRFVLVPERLRGRTPAARDKRISYVTKRHAEWLRFDTELSHGPFVPAPSEALKHFAPDFVYDYVKVPGVTVGQVLDLGAHVMRDASLYASQPKGPSPGLLDRLTWKEGDITIVKPTST